MIFIARAFPYWITVVGVLGVMAVIFFTNHDGAIGRPHWPARTPHHKPGHARGGPPAIAAPKPSRDVVYRANARSELVRQYAVRVREHIADELGMDRRAQGGRS